MTRRLSVVPGAALALAAIALLVAPSRRGWAGPLIPFTYAAGSLTVASGV
jgi:hypothetical protein